MRLATFLTTTFSALALTAAAQAAPLGPVADVNVAIGPELQAKADQYGQRDLDYLAAELRESVQKAFERAGGLSADGATIDLVLEDAVPNRPTFQQMARTPGLSMESFGIGGAEITGVLNTADGQRIPVSYRWYETDIRWAIGSATWTDAQNTFDRFARRLASGGALAQP